MLVFVCGTYVNWIPPVQTKEQQQKRTMMDPGNDEEDSEVVLGKLCSVVHAKLWLLSFCVDHGQVSCSSSILNGT